MSLAKLTSVSTKTLSLLLERQRLQTLPTFQPLGPLDSDNATPSNPLHLPQIKKNLAQLRSGIAELEKKEGSGSEAATLLRNQYERMRAMLGPDAAGIPSLDQPMRESSPSPQPSTYATPVSISPSALPSVGLTGPRGTMASRFSTFSSSSDNFASAVSSPSSSLTPVAHTRASSNNVFAPYTDDPSGRPAPVLSPSSSGGVVEGDTGILLQTQRFIMSEQDQRLDELSHSINRQHHISLQINNEMDVHMGLLNDLEAGVDNTAVRLSGARRKLNRVARGIKENSSVFAIGLLIFVLLVLIIVLKT